MKKFVRRLLNRVLDRPALASDQHTIDFTKDELNTLAAVQAFTMTSPQRVVSLIRAVEHVVKWRLPGDIVECGVWRGGSMLTTALTLRRLGETDRALWLFDTFSGMTEPTSEDIEHSGATAKDIMAVSDVETSHVWAKASLQDVKHTMSLSHYPEKNVRFIEGDVCQTIPSSAPDQIALLRLDTDWYESTRHELEHLYPRLIVGGILIIDDYGYWQGAKKAVDEYFENHRIPMLLSRIDYTGRIGVKPG